MPKEYQGVEAQLQKIYLDEYCRLWKPVDKLACLKRMARIARESKLKHWELYIEGGLEVEQGNSQEAMALYDQSLKIDPNWAYPWNGKGLALLFSKRYNESLAAYEKAIELDASYAFPWYGKGNLLRELNRYVEALAAYDKAIELASSHAAPWYGKGVAFNELKRYNEAIAAFDKAIQLDPGNVASWNGKGNALSESKRYDEALVTYNKAIKLDPTFSSYPWNGRGNVFYFLKRHNEAIAAYNKAIEVDPKDADPWNGRGNVLRQLKRYDEARRSYMESVRLAPTYWRPYYNYGLLFQDKELDRDSALDTFNKAFANNPPMEYVPIIILWIMRLKEMQKKASHPDMTGQGYDLTSSAALGADFYTNLINSDLLEEAIDERKKLKENLSKAYEPGEFSVRSDTLFILRDWNSYTPILAKKFRPPDFSRPTEMLGGGYFLTWKGHGIAIDPGIDFVTQLYNKKLSIRDVNSIVITHCHLDHFQDVESLVDLNYRLSQHEDSENPNPSIRQLKFWLSMNAHAKYSTWVMRSRCCEQAQHLNIGSSKQISPHIELKAVHVFHKDIMSEEDAIGLIINLKKEDESPHLRIGVTSDTKWDDSLQTSFEGCKILIAHLGSLETLSDFSKGERLKNHLGLRGCYDLMTAIKPRIFIVGEFGEELFMLRMKILNALHKHRPPGTTVLAGDSNLAISLDPELSVYCSHPNCDGQRIPLDKLKPISGDDMLFRYYCDEHSLGEKK